MTAPETPERDVKVFISYSRTDGQLVDELIAALERPGIRCFKDTRDISFDEYWNDRLEAEIERSQLVLFVYSQSSGESKYVEAEIDYAESMRIPVCLLLRPGVRLNERYASRGFAQRNALCLPETGIGNLQPVLDLLVGHHKALHGNMGSISRDDNPYPGFGPFTKDQAKFYFGRENDCESLANTIYDGSTPGSPAKRNAESRATNSLILAYGPSGVGKSSLLRIGLPARLRPDDWISKPIQFVQLAEGEDRARFLMRAAYRELCESEEADVPEQIPSEGWERAIHQFVLERSGESRRKYILCFDQMEELFELRTGTTEASDFLGSLLRLLKEPNIKIIVSFREEALGAVERRIDEQQIPCCRWRINELSPKQALNCIVEPAKARGVEFQASLANAIVQVLSRPQGRNSRHELTYSIEPVSLQIVCRSLWVRVAHSHDKINNRIHESVLPQVGENLLDRVQHFVKEAVTEYLDKVILEAAEEQHKVDSAISTGQWLEFIQTSLVLFLGPGQGQKRRRVCEVSLADGTRRVGRFPEALIRVMVNKGLVHRCEDSSEYELVHDVLAETINDRYGRSVMLVTKLNILESSLVDAAKSPSVRPKHRQGSRHDEAGEETYDTKTSLDGYFNENATLLKDLEPNREVLLPDESVFLLRCALGNHASRSETGRVLPLQWALKVGQESPARLVEVMCDGLKMADDDDGRNQRGVVTLDVIDLFRNPELQKYFAGQTEVSQHLQDLLPLLKDLALKARKRVREMACIALLENGGREEIRSVFELCSSFDRNAIATLTYLRHGADLARGASTHFWNEWKKKAIATRLVVLVSMCLLRCRQSFPQIIIILFITSILTAIGASIPFAIVGNFGASITLADSDGGALKGLFYGVFGGVVWGVLIPLSMLLYSVLWKGGRIQPRRETRFSTIAWAMLGGLIGGLINTIMIAYVYRADSIMAAGWVDGGFANGSHGLMYEVLFATRCGLALPIFGAMAGAGIGWSLSIIMHDPQKSWDDQGKALSTVSEMVKMLRAILSRVLWNFWINAILVTIAAVLVFHVVHLGNLASASSLERPVTQLKHALHPAPLAYRCAGLIPVMFFGSLALEVALLFSIVSMRLGVHVDQNHDFLRVATKAQE